VPRRECSPTDEKLRFIGAFLADVFSFSGLCAFFAICRRAGYKWVERCKSEGRPGLEDRPHATPSCPRRTQADVVAALLVTRRKPT
jgi:hypothetical protein